MSIEIIKNLTILHRIDEDLDSDDDETVCFVGHAEILYHGAKVSTEIHEAKPIMKNHFEVTAYDWGGDLQIGDEQTFFYIDGECAGLFWELPDALQDWATKEVKRILKEIKK